MRQNIFRRIEETKSVFACEAAFSPEYLPELVLFRDKEITEVAHHFAPLLKGIPERRVLLLCGPSGSGKSTVIRHVLREFSDYAQRNRSVYLHAPFHQTAYAALVEILEQIGVPTARRGHAPDELVKAIKEEVEREDLCIAVALDDIDRMPKSEVERIIHHLTALGSKIPLSIVASCNTLALLRRVDERIKVLLLGKVLRINPYAPKEIKEILLARARIGFVPGMWQEEAVETCAGITVKHGRNLKFGMHLLLAGGRIADRQGETLRPEHIQQAVAEAKALLRETELEGMSKEERTVYETIERYAPLTTGELYRKLSMKERTIRNYLKRLEEKGLIRLTPVLSASGNTRMIELI